MAAREHVVKHLPQGVDVRSQIHVGPTTAFLLWRHEEESADGLSRLRDALKLLHKADTKVGQAWTSESFCHEENISWLDVSVDYHLLVGFLGTEQDLTAHLQGKLDPTDERRLLAL